MENKITITPEKGKMIMDLICLTCDLVLNEIIAARRKNDEQVVEQLKRVQKVLSSECFIDFMLRAKEWPATPKGIKTMICESWI